MTGERYITDSLDRYPIGLCPKCAGSIGHADLTRREDWASWPGGDADVAFLWTAEGELVCASCEASRPVTADVQSGSVQQVFASMVQINANL
jgi:hypothetical protein